MAERFMVLPSEDVSRIRVVTVPEDMSSHEAYRYLTGLIAEIERTGDDRWVEDVLDALEDHGFESVECAIGPHLD
ncbi:MAG: hypothetical protein U9Q81_03990 [Pseudomonadota bacterium]|nr:hypothetical protein [Pseudomonadota bacterium]